MLKNKLLCVLLLLASLGASAQSTNQHYLNYIATYSDMAVEQQRLYSIPASVTLAQGLLESAAGRSTLAREGNNHFGIKCHRNWTGATMLRDDDAPDECFRVYESAAESFRDHSLFLLGRRYARLFDLDPTDFEGWARGLSACGYATDPNYADRLISIIRRYELYDFDLGSTHKAESDADFILGQMRDRHIMRRSRGLHYVIANPGDTYASIAAEFALDPSQLAVWNDAADTVAEIKPWEEVYFQSKLEKAPSGVSRVTIGEDESAHSVAQRFGVKMSLIEKHNPGYRDEPGTVLRLR